MREIKNLGKDSAGPLKKRAVCYSRFLFFICDKRYVNKPSVSFLPISAAQRRAGR